MEGEEVEEQKTNNKKECLFSFSKLNKYYIIPFLWPVMDVIRDIIIDLIDSDLASEGVKNTDFLMDILDCLSTIAGGSLYFAFSVRTKTEETRKQRNELEKKVKKLDI